MLVEYPVNPWILRRTRLERHWQRRPVFFAVEQYFQKSTERVVRAPRCQLPEFAVSSCWKIRDASYISWRRKLHLFIRVWLIRLDGLQFFYFRYKFLRRFKGRNIMFRD